MTVGERIKQRRLELGWTQEELATKLGCKSRSSVNKVELSNDLTLKTVRAYANALGVDATYLMGWEEKNNKYSHIDTDYLAKIVTTPGDWEWLTMFKDLSISERNEIMSYVNYIKSKRKN